MGHIVIERPDKIKEIARDWLKGAYFKLCVGFLVAFLIVQAVPSALDQIFYNPHTYTVLGMDFTVNLSYVGYAFRILVEGPLSLGVASYGLHFFRSKEVDNKRVVSAFRQPGKALEIAIRTNLSVLAGTVLLIVPGFIAWFQRSQAYYIMIDNPELTAKECIEKSKEMMRGNKARLFSLLFSFILWYLLIGFAGAGILAIPASGLLCNILKILSSVAIVPLSPFIALSRVVFYELVTENLVPVRKDKLSDRQPC